MNGDKPYLPRTWLRLTLLCLVALGCVNAQAQKRNLIIILADDLGPNDLGCFGQSRIITPNIDALAQSGMKFSDVCAVSSIDRDARLGLLTGRHSGGLKGEATSIAAILKSNGYATAYIGRWGIGDWKIGDAGFDFTVLDGDLAKEGQLYPETLSVNGSIVALKNEVYTDTDGARRRKRVDYVNDRFAEHAIQLLDASKDKPFCLVFAPTIPAVNPARTDRDLEPPIGEDPYTAENWPPAEKNKAFAITRLDEYVGQIVAKLDELKLTDQTLIILTSDTPSRTAGNTKPEFFRSNGPYRGEPGELFEGSLRVPLILVMKDVITSGENAQRWAMWELFPTICELLNIRTAATAQQLSMSPALNGKKVEGIFGRFFFFQIGNETIAVRWQNWKYIRREGKSPMLFNLIGDPQEMRDVSLSNEKVVERMEAFIAEVNQGNQ